MTDRIDIKTRLRFLLLHKIYEITGGVAERHALDIKQIGDDMGVGPYVALETFDFLRAEGLGKWVAAGYKGTITALGLEEIQDALNQKRSVHFPANIIALANSPDVPVAAKQEDAAAAHAGTDEQPVHVETITVINQETSTVSLPRLAAVLTTVRKAMSEKAASMDDYIALGHVAAAEKAAIHSDAPLAFEHLRQINAHHRGISCKLSIEVASANTVHKFIIDL